MVVQNGGRIFTVQAPAAACLQSWIRVKAKYLEWLLDVNKVAVCGEIPGFTWQKLQIPSVLSSHSTSFQFMSWFYCVLFTLSYSVYNKQVG